MKPVITLKSFTEDALRYVKQLGVDYVKMDVALVPGFGGKGRLTRNDLMAAVKRVEELDLHLDFFGVAKGMMLAPLLAGDPLTEGNLEMVEETIECLGEVEGAMLELDSGIHSYDKIYPQPCAGVGYYEIEGRGGAKVKTFDLGIAKQNPDYRTKLGEVNRDKVWQRMLELYRYMVPIAEAHKVKVCWEGDDPPIPDYRDLHRPLSTIEDMDRLLEEVPSDYHGIIYCIGTRAAAGEDVTAGLRHFIEKGKLFHIHSRNIKGQVPHWEEDFLDEGRLDMLEIFRSLRDADYTGYLAPDSFAHYPRILDEAYPGLLSMAYAVGYMKAMLDAVYGE